MSDKIQNKILTISVYSPTETSTRFICRLTTFILLNLSKFLMFTSKIIRDFLTLSLDCSFYYRLTTTPRSTLLFGRETSPKLDVSTHQKKTSDFISHQPSSSLSYLNSFRNFQNKNREEVNGWM